MRIVEREEVLSRLSMERCLQLMREAFIALEQGAAKQPVRTVEPLPGGDLFAFMPAYAGDHFGAKLITVFPRNHGSAYPSHQGYVALFESAHGSMVGMAEGSAITQVRTGAVSGVATDLLANEDAHTLAIIGAGVQGRSHLEAMLLVRDIREVRIYDIHPQNALRYQQEMQQKFGIRIQVCESAEQAVRDAEIICTVTPSEQPYLRREWIRPGAHINAVGTCSPTTREVTSELFAASAVYADQMEAFRRESGEYLIPLSEGLISEDHAKGTIGGLLCGTAVGRTDREQITLFDALGLAVEDVACARFLLT